MVATQLSPKKYEDFKRQLIMYARQEPLDASFTFNMTINNEEYILKLQLDRQKIYALQALKIDREIDNYIHHELITNNCTLLSLLHILINQGLK